MREYPILLLYQYNCKDFINLTSYCICQWEPISTSPDYCKLSCNINLTFAFNSPDTAKKEMENFDNKLFCLNFYQILKYFTHPSIFHQILSQFSNGDNDLYMCPVLIQTKTVGAFWEGQAVDCLDVMIFIRHHSITCGDAVSWTWRCRFPIGGFDSNVLTPFLKTFPKWRPSFFFIFGTGDLMMGMCQIAIKQKNLFQTTYNW